MKELMNLIEQFLVTKMLLIAGYRIPVSAARQRVSNNPQLSARNINH